MIKIISPSKVSGSIPAPTSKSYAHRALVCAALASGISHLTNILDSQDINVTICSLQQLGVSITQRQNETIVEGINGHFPLLHKNTILNMKESGTSLRFFTALGALTNGTLTITGSQRLRQRPIKHLLELLRLLGIKSRLVDQGVEVTGGNLNGGRVESNDDSSSQFISALLLISPYASQDVHITVSQLPSAPYLDITLDVMKEFSGSVKQNGNSYSISHLQKYKGRTYSIEGDYSSVSYLFAAAAIVGTKISVSGLNVKSVQGDRFFLEILKKMGCTISVDDEFISLESSKNLNGIEIDMQNYPDIVPSVCAVAAYAHGTTHITNIGHLRHKESDRIQALTESLVRFGIKATQTANAIIIDGGIPMGTQIEPHNDHRIAMSMSVLALGAKGNTAIEESQVVEKSYPRFWGDLQKLGAHIT